jgi:hypothetical protein
MLRAAGDLITTLTAKAAGKSQFDVPMLRTLSSKSQLRLVEFADGE